MHQLKYTAAVVMLDSIFFLFLAAMILGIMVLGINKT
jgi:uncharacterized membrane protein